MNLDKILWIVIGVLAAAILNAMTALFRNQNPVHELKLMEGYNGFKQVTGPGAAAETECLWCAKEYDEDDAEFVAQSEPWVMYSQENEPPSLFCSRLHLELYVVNGYTVPDGQN